MGTLADRGGKKPEARVRGGCEAPTWRADRGSGQGRGGRRMRQTSAHVRVGKGHHVVRGVDSETPLFLCSCARAVSGCLCLCLPLPARALLGSMCVCVSAQLRVNISFLSQSLCSLCCVCRACCSCCWSCVCSGSATPVGRQG